MGIKGLLPLLESIHKHVHLRDFAGSALGIDAYGWLHRGLFACAADIAQGKPSRAYVDFAMHRVRMLQHFGVTPYVVFDGAHLPSKAHTEKERREKRQQSRQQGMALLQAGKSWLAYPELQKSVDVTPAMARELIEELKAAGVSYVVAPYEADSQLAYLEKHGHISGIISEDSDLLVFGANRLITKLDQYGECVMIQRADFTSCTKISLVNWSDKEFRIMCILSGCDYLPNVPSLGLITAYRLIRKHKTIEQIVRFLQFDSTKKVPVGYLDAFRQAENSFLYAWAFDPKTKALQNLNEIPNELNVEDMPYLGRYHEPEIAQGVAVGALEPNSKERLATPKRQATVWPPKRQTSVQQTPDMKMGKPITEFFKSARTPLAELDPNSFTPSPSQRNLLEGQRNRSWSVNQIPGNRRSLSNTIQHSAPQLRNIKRAIEKAQPKRPRLCNDTSAEKETGLVSSHYFAKPNAASPLQSRTTKKGKDNFELFSDDSTIGAMLDSAIEVKEEIRASQAVKTEKSPAKRKKIDVFNDEQPGRRQSLESQRTSEASQTSRPTLSTASSFITSQIVTESAFTADTTSFASLSSKWLHNPLLDQIEYQSTTKPDTPKEAAFEEEREQLEAPRASIPASPASAELDRPRTPIMDDERVPQSSPPPVPQTPASHRSASRREKADKTVPAASPAVLLSPRLNLLSQSMTHFKGSEDFLIPQSPSSDREDEGVRPRPDFSRFLFAV